jgi:aspartate aminotransferase-like enzyme
MIRVGHMGLTAMPRHIVSTFHALEDVLAKIAYGVRPGTGAVRSWPRA